MMKGCVLILFLVNTITAKPVENKDKKDNITETSDVVCTYLLTIPFSNKTFDKNVDELMQNRKKRKLLLHLSLSLVSFLGALEHCLSERWTNHSAFLLVERRERLRWPWARTWSPSYV